ncbi:MAG TPA: cysteine dioxygenase family protein [Actinopolymorphaceae bacterium]|nr:cysteine dioxygenase family protein [Actinopolymorphaceae bacterium]
MSALSLPFGDSPVDPFGDSPVDPFGGSPVDPIGDSRVDEGGVSDYPVGIQPAVAKAAALVRRLASDSSRWRDRVSYGHGDQRWFARLDVYPHHEVWLISWLPGQTTGLHDHGEALGAFAVVEGTLTETVIEPGARQRSLVTAGDKLPTTPTTPSVVTVRRRFDAGQVRGFGYAHVHDVGNHGTRPSISVHAYAPELTAMTKYVLEDRRLRVVASERVGLDW